MDSFSSPEEFKEQCGYEIEGTWYPRVTKIVGIKAKPALYRFYASMPSFRHGEEMKERSASEGTLVHDAVEAIVLGKDAPVDPSIAPSIDAFRQFLEFQDVQVNPDFVEYRLHHPDHRYAGTVDAVVSIGGKHGVMDIKTSQAIYRDYNLQTSAYMAALQPLLPHLSTRWILRIDQDQQCRNCGARLRVKGGREKIRARRYDYFFRTCSHDWGPMEGRVQLKEFDNWERDFKAFLGAKTLWEWEHHDWLEKIGY
jgi:hypothetical protein